VDDAQIIVAPYNILLLKESREAYGIKLKGNIVIIDEAHNLLETESSIHSAEVSLLQVCLNFFGHLFNAFNFHY